MNFLQTPIHVPSADKTPTATKTSSHRSPVGKLADATNVAAVLATPVSSNLKALPTPSAALPAAVDTALQAAIQEFTRQKCTDWWSDASIEAVAKAVLAPLLAKKVSSLVEETDPSTVSSQLSRYFTLAEKRLTDLSPDVTTRQTMKLLPFGFVFSMMLSSLRTMPAKLDKLLEHVPDEDSRIPCDVVTSPIVSTVQQMLAQLQSSDAPPTVNIRQLLFRLMGRLVLLLQRADVARSTRCASIWLDIVAANAAHMLSPEATVFEFLAIVPLRDLYHQVRTALLYRKVAHGAKRKVKVEEYEILAVMKRTLRGFAGKSSWTLSSHVEDYFVSFDAITQKLHLALRKDGELHALHREIKKNVPPKRFLDKTQVTLGSVPVSDKSTVTLDSSGAPDEAALLAQVEWDSGLKRALQRPLYYLPKKDAAAVCVTIPPKMITKILQHFVPASETADSEDNSTSSDSSSSSDSENEAENTHQTAQPSASTDQGTVGRAPGADKAGTTNAATAGGHASSSTATPAPAPTAPETISGHKRKAPEGGKRIGRPRACRRQNMMLFRNSFIRTTEANLIRIATSKVTAVESSDVMICIQEAAVFGAYVQHQSLKEAFVGDDEDKTALRVAEVVICADGGVFPLVRLRNSGIFRESSAQLGICLDMEKLPKPPQVASEIGGDAVTTKGVAVYTDSVRFTWHSASAGWDATNAWIKTLNTGLDEPCVMIALSHILDNPQSTPHFPPASFAHVLMPEASSEDSDSEGDSDAGSDDGEASHSSSSDDDENARTAARSHDNESSAGAGENVDASHAAVGEENVATPKDNSELSVFSL